jgi:hypothetical protein
MRLRGAVGIHRQSPGYEKLAQSDNFTDLRGSGPLGLENERAEHILLGLERTSSSGLTTRVEAYYKNFDQTIIRRLETSEERAARLAHYDFPPDLAWSLPTDSIVTSIPGNDGRGRAWGFDLWVARKATSPATRLTGWGSYTFGIAEQTNYGRTYPFEYDRRHAVSVVVDYRVARKFRLSAVARVASGFPYTPVLGLRVASAQDVLDTDHDGNTVEFVPQRDASGMLAYQPYRGGVDNYLSARLPYYARLDVRATFTPDWGRGRVWFYVDVINALGRTNPGAMNTSLEYEPGADRPRLVTTPSGSMPFLPSFGMHVDLNRPKAPRRPSSKPSDADSARRRGIAVGIRPTGTVGFGVEAVAAFSRRLGVRGVFGIPTTLPFPLTATGTPYDVKIPLGASTLRLDWHPWAGRIHVSGGVYFPRPRMTLETTTAETYDVGSTVYSATDIGPITGTATFRRAAPYVGLGFGSPVFGSRRFGIGFDVGVAFQGAPSVALAASGPLASDPVFQQNLAQETRDVASALRGFRVWPALSLSLTYRLR